MRSDGKEKILAAELKRAAYAFCILMISQAVASCLLNLFFDRDSTLFYCASLVFMPCVGIPVILSHLYETEIHKPLSDSIKIKNVSIGYLLRFAMFSILSLLALSWLITLVTTPLKTDTTYSIGNNDTASIVVYFIASTLLAPIAEELFYRWWIAGCDCALISTRSVLSALLFTVMHFSLLNFAYYIYFSFLSEYLYIKTKSIIPSIILHSAMNLIMFLSWYIEGGM